MSPACFMLMLSFISAICWIITKIFAVKRIAMTFMFMKSSLNVTSFEVDVEL